MSRNLIARCLIVLTLTCLTAPTWTTAASIPSPRCLSDLIASAPLNANGFRIATPDIPAGFDPATATDSRLACYGFPPRPADAQGRARWMRTVGAAKHYVNLAGMTFERGPAVVPPTSPGPSASSIISSSNWGGYVFDVANQSYGSSLWWKEVSSSWSVPTAIYGSAHAWLSTWVGLGGVYSGATILQAGTYQENQNQNPATYGWWWQNYNPACNHAGTTQDPCPSSCNAPSTHYGDPLLCPESSAVLGGLTQQQQIHPGQEANVDIRYLNPDAYFYLENQTNGTYGLWAMDYPTTLGYNILVNSGTTKTADFVMEDSNWSNGQYPAFATTVFSDTYMQGIYGNYSTTGNAYQFVSTDWQLCFSGGSCGLNGTNAYAQPSLINTSGLFAVCYNKALFGCPSP